MDRADKILNMAENSVFYRNNDGVYRIEWADMDEGYFQVIDEDAGEEYRIEPKDVKDTDVFYKTVRVSVSQLLAEQRPSS